MPYNPNQPRDPGGKDGGRWIKAGGRVTADIQEAINNMNEALRDSGNVHYSATSFPRDRLRKDLQRAIAEKSEWVYTKAPSGYEVEFRRRDVEAILRAYP